MKHFKDVPRDGRMKARKKYAEGGGIDQARQELARGLREREERLSSIPSRIMTYASKLGGPKALEEMKARGDFTSSGAYAPFEPRRGERKRGGRN